MKMLIASLFVFAGSFAQAGVSNQEALQQTLKSDAVAAITKPFSRFELTEVKVKQLENTNMHDSIFAIELFYSALGTAGGCYVHANATADQMEVVKRDGGFEIRTMWKVSAEQGICPR